LLALPALLMLATRRSVAGEALASLVDAELLPHLLQGRERRQKLPYVLLAVG
jgi:Ca-activated chloride channel family protein